MSKKFWDQLSEQEKKIINESAAEAQTFQRKVSRDQEAKALEALKKEGMQINELPPAELAKLREKAKPVVAKFGGEIKETVDQLTAELAKNRK
jgi:TRAP-type C4-dicarboxylate transport system substrate-binding protein